MDLNNLLQEKMGDNNLPSIKYGFLIIGIYAVISLILTPIIELIFNFLPISQTWRTFVSFSLSFGILLPIAMKIWRSKTFDTKALPILHYVILLPGIIALAIITEGIVSLIPMPDVVAEFFANMIKFNLPDFLTVGIAAPIFEELIFRGVILKGFLKKYNPQKAILWSAAIFGIAHLNPWQFIAAFLVGIIIGWLYWKTKSIWPGIFVHFVNNSFSFYLGYRANDINISFSEFVGGNLNYTLLFLASLIVLYFVSKFFLKQYKETTVIPNES